MYAFETFENISHKQNVIFYGHTWTLNVLRWKWTMMIRGVRQARTQEMIHIVSVLMTPFFHALFV